MTPPNPDSLPREGDMVAGKYRVERILGAGGMGVVVAAHHVQLDERVALKFLLPDAIASSEVIGRFVREARAAAKIKNEHVARVRDVGELENGSPYMVMEYLEGSDLSRWLAQRGPLPVEQAVDFVLQACEALAEAHVLGIVHRDLKPANLFCTQKADGVLSIKVLDFGISKIMNPAPGGSEMTKTASFLGSPLYMSPEQLQLSKGVDARTDVWSLGVILFELVTGQPPFNADAVTELIIKIATAPAPAVRTLRPDAPAVLEAVLARCLDKDRDRRFQTVADLAVALQGFGSSRGRMSVEGIVATLQRAGAPPATAGPSTAPAALVASGEPALTSGAWGQTGPVAGSRLKVAAAVASLATVAAIALVVLFLLRGSGHTPSASTGLVTIGPEPSAVAAAPPTTLPVARDPVATPPPSATPSASSSASPSAPSASTPTAARPTPAATMKPAVGAPATAPPPAASAAPNCNPRYFYDSNGNKHYKPECFPH